MPDFVLNRTHTLRTTAGHVINFVKGQPTWVPPMLVKEATVIGAEPVDGPRIDVLDDEPAPAPQYDAEDREKLIYMAFEQIVEKNERGAFSSNGSPNKQAVERIVGFEVTTKERQDLWQKFRESKAAEA